MDKRHASIRKAKWINGAEYDKGVLACIGGELITEGANKSFTAGYARQYEFEQMDGALGGRQQF